MKISRQFAQFSFLSHLFKWLLIATIVGVFAGFASSLFLISLAWVTRWREGHSWIIGFLPVAGLATGWAYFKLGSQVEAGNNLLIDEIHNPRQAIPVRMAPMVFVGSILTHLFGGSAGREGAAVQMGGSLADQLALPLQLSSEDRKILLMAGISAGFGSVFGTPLAGMVFGLEVLSIGKLRYDAMWPCLVAALVGDYVTLLLGVQHASYRIPVAAGLTMGGFFYAAIAGAFFGVVGRMFAKATHVTSRWAKERILFPPFRPMIGGLLVAILVWAMGTTRYIGLGIPVIQSAFIDRLPAWDFAAKFLFTVITLGFGFKGGEVTPLFFVGATLGNTLSYALPIPAPVLAAMGFAAVFAGAANTPLACTLMGIELFGHESAPYLAIACVVSYLFSGHAGIYHAQRPGHHKHGRGES